MTGTIEFLQMAASSTSGGLEWLVTFTTTLDRFGSHNTRKQARETTTTTNTKKMTAKTQGDGDEDTKDGGEDEEGEGDEEFETEDDISEKPDTSPNERNRSIILACRPTQHLLTDWNPPHRLLSTSDLLQWSAYTEDTSRGASSWRMGTSSWILSLLN